MLGFTGLELLVIMSCTLLQLYFVKSLLDNRAIVWAQNDHARLYIRRSKYENKTMPDFIYEDQNMKIKLWMQYLFFFCLIQSACIIFDYIIVWGSTCNNKFFHWISAHFKSSNGLNGTSIILSTNTYLLLLSTGSTRLNSNAAIFHLSLSGKTNKSSQLSKETQR